VEGGGTVIPRLGMKKEGNPHEQNPGRSHPRPCRRRQQVTARRQDDEARSVDPRGRAARCRRSTLSGEMAVETDIDTVHLEFAIDADGLPEMTGINLVLPRKPICFIQSECRLSLLSGQDSAMIMPQDHVRGHFKILPGEIFQAASKPSALSRGISRETQRLATLVRDGVEVDKQVILHEWC
jgi:hypothetical protein